MIHFLYRCRWISLLLLVLAAVAGSGCASTGDSANMSERPWNAPADWETGMGGMFNQYR